ncbi:hypothetical protein [Levilactobacillus andaensis]|uniref:hypothetical protein n=1 Tax=Levilactobacillus andaensis TaxID=2799570 RepID=UPI0019447573|nr:hypothetical protein [Levilactobacillus andaensis]
MRRHKNELYEALKANDTEAIQHLRPKKLSESVVILLHYWQPAIFADSFSKIEDHYNLGLTTSQVIPEVLKEDNSDNLKKLIFSRGFDRTDASLTNGVAAYYAQIYDFENFSLACLVLMLRAPKEFNKSNIEFLHQQLRDDKEYYGFQNKLIANDFDENSEKFLNDFLFPISIYSKLILLVNEATLENN